MEYETKEVIKKIGIGVVAALVAGAGVSGYFMSQPEPEPVVITNEVIVTKEVPVVVEVPVEVENVVEVEDTDKIDYLSQRIIDMGLVDEDFSPIDVFMAEDFALAEAIECAIKDMPDMLEDEDLIKDEDKMSVLKVYKDYEDVEIIKSDFEEGEYKFVIKFKIEDTKTDDKFKVFATVKVDEDVELVKIEKEE